MHNRTRKVNAMPDRHEPESAQAAARSSRRTSPSSSRMIASYLTDIEQMLDEQRWDAALREASDLPRIAVALADPALRSSGEQVKTWCEAWVRPSAAEQDADEAEYERLARNVTEHVVPPSGREPVPTRALRRLQLRRHLRTPPRGFSPERAAHLDAQETEAAQIGVALVEATRRWYARSGVHDPTVQDNLARLAVLR
jgi:hypothetical protein